MLIIIGRDWPGYYYTRGAPRNIFLTNDGNVKVGDLGDPHPLDSPEAPRALPLATCSCLHVARSTPPPPLHTMQYIIRNPKEFAYEALHNKETLHMFPRCDLPRHLTFTPALLPPSRIVHMYILIL